MILSSTRETAVLPFLGRRDLWDGVQDAAVILSGQCRGLTGKQARPSDIPTRISVASFCMLIILNCTPFLRGR